MENINAKIDGILAAKSVEVKNLLSSKPQNKKMTESDALQYSAKTTLYKINAEQEKKLKSSKAYQKKEQIFG